MSFALAITPRRNPVLLARLVREYAAATRREETAATLPAAYRCAAVSQRALRDLQAAQAGQSLPSLMARAARAARVAARAVARAFARAAARCRARIAAALVRAMARPLVRLPLALVSLVLAACVACARRVWRRDALVGWIECQTRRLSSS